MRNEDIIGIEYSPAITYNFTRKNGVIRVVNAKVTSIEPTAYLAGGDRIRVGAMQVDVDLEFDEAGHVSLDLPDEVVEDVRYAIATERVKRRVKVKVEQRIADIVGAP